MMSLNSSSSAGTPSSNTSMSSTRDTCGRRSSSPARGRSQTLGSMDVSTLSPPQVTGESSLMAPIGHGVTIGWLCHPRMMV